MSNVDTHEKARYVQLALNRKFGKGDKFNILIPKSNNVVTEILKEYDADNKQLEGGKIGCLEEEINNLVYALYGLSKEDQEIIEKFLDKF